MRDGFGKLLIFLLFSRMLILVLPWITTTLISPDIIPYDFEQFTRISWNRWDAPHYIYLAQNWYTNMGDAANFIVFFPFYPMILGVLTTLFGNPQLTAVFLSIFLFIVGAYFFYKLILMDYPKKIAEQAVIYLSIFPTAYFFNSPSTESLFVLLFSLTMYAARKEKWIVAGIFAGLATITRPVGILLLPTILTEWFLNKERQWKYLGILILPSILGLLFYLNINQMLFGDPFQFQKTLHSNWQKHFSLPLNGILDSWRIAFSGELTNFTVLVGWAEAITTTLSWLLIPFIFLKLRRSWAIFYTLNVIAFSSTGFILSTPRYLLSIPPLFVFIALNLKSETLKNIWMVTSVALLFCLSIIYTRGQWAF